MYIHYGYSTIQSHLLKEPISGVAAIQDISYRINNSTYCITCCLKPDNFNHNATIQIYVKEKPTFQIHDTIRVHDLIFSKSFSETYKQYLFKEFIHATLYSSCLKYTIIEKNNSLSRNILIHYIQEKISLKLSKISSTLFNTLFLGARYYQERRTSDTEKSLYEYFNIWGINHFIARSGLHVSLILFIVHAIIKAIYMPLFLSYMVLISFLFMYALFSYSSISFYRAVIMSFFALWGLLFKRPIGPMHIINISSLIMIIYNPFSIFSLDFQLTFLLTGALCIFSLIKE